MRYLTGLCLLLFAIAPAQAHLMVAQHGTLNLVGDGVYMVLSLPVSAFAGSNDDGDDKLSSEEFNKHRPNIVEAIKQHVRLLDANGPRPLEGMMLSPVAAHDAPKAPTEQMVVMGRFVLDQPVSATALHFHIGLFGQQKEELSFTIIAQDKTKALKHKAVLTPAQNHMPLLEESATE